MVACASFAIVGLLGHFLHVSQLLMLVGMCGVGVAYYRVFCSGRFFQREGEPPRADAGRWYWPLT